MNHQTSNYYQVCTCMTGIDIESDHKDPNCPIHGNPPEAILTTYPAQQESTEELREAVKDCIRHARHNAVHFTSNQEEADANINFEADQIMALVAAHEAASVQKAKANLQFDLMTDLSLSLMPLLVHTTERGFPENSADMIRELNKWQQTRFKEAYAELQPKEGEQ